MTARSPLGTYYTLPTASFDADQPVSALRSYLVRNNIQHLIDVSGQYRVSWCADLGQEGLRHDSGLDPATPKYMSWEFPVTMQQSDHPPNFDIRVAVKLESAGSSSVLAAIGPASAPREPKGGENAQQWFRTVEATAATTAVWAIDTQWEWTAPSLSYLAGLQRFSVTESSLSQPVDVVLARLEVAIIGTTAELESGVLGVQLREYA